MRTRWAHGYEWRVRGILAAPVITGLSVKGSEDTGYTAECLVQGSPLPDVQWLVHDELIEASSSSPISQGSHEHYQHSSQLQGVLSGQQYTCTASNPLGKDQATLYMVVPRKVHVSGEAPSLLLLLSLSLGAKVLLLLGMGACVLQRGGLAWPRCWFK
ncbi:hypothetical protein UPYG_G00155560 [Umbra pygmaea]|uniref:Ig-like domain-containing protein n=1 Tax=Umbra pygmaea TaxID=75934 RepID=A0ABD0WY35_UMBPY